MFPLKKVGTRVGTRVGTQETQQPRGFNRYVPTVPTNSHLFIVSWKILHAMHEFHASHAKFYKNMVCISKKWEQWEHPAQPA